MFAVSETELQRCVLSLVIYLLLCCLVSGVKNDQTSQTNDEATSNNQQTMGSHYCHGPPEPLVVVKAFVPVGVRTAHSENIYNTIRPKAPFSPNTTVIFDCQLANGVTYTLVHSGSTRFTCVQPDGTVDATWDKPFPKCERNVCWWLGNETNLQFFYEGRMLNNATQRGFPKGTKLHFLNWECKAGKHAHVNPLTCSTLGEWNGIYPACVADNTSVTSSSTLSTTREASRSPPENDGIRKESERPSSPFNWKLCASLTSIASVALTLSLAITCHTLSKVRRALNHHMLVRYDYVFALRKTNSFLSPPKTGYQNYEDIDYSANKLEEIEDSDYIGTLGILYSDNHSKATTTSAAADMQCYAKPVNRVKLQGRSDKTSNHSNLKI